MCNYTGRCVSRCCGCVADRVFMRLSCFLEVVVVALLVTAMIWFIVTERGEHMRALMG